MFKNISPSWDCKNDKTKTINKPAFCHLCYVMILPFEESKLWVECVGIYEYLKRVFNFGE